MVNADVDGKFNSGIPDDVKLFDVFWEQIQELIDARPEFNFEDIVSLYTSLNSLALNCYPDRLEYIDRILGTTRSRLAECVKQQVDVMRLGNTKDYLYKLLKDPIVAYKSNILTLLRFPSGKASQIGSDHPKSNYFGGNYTELLYLQSYGVRRQVAHCAVNTVLSAALEYDFIVPSVDAVNFLLGEICSIMIRDQVDGNLFGSNASRNGNENDFKDETEGPFGWDEVVFEQTLMAQLIHVIKSATNDPTDEFNLLNVAKDHFRESGEIRIRFTFAPVVTSMVRLAKTFKSHEDKTVLIELLKGVHNTIGILSKAREYFAEDDNYTPLFSEEVLLNQSSVKIGRGLLSPPETALNLYLMGARVSDLTQQEDLCYEFFVEAFTMYEESISESKAQVHAITQIISTLYKTTVFGFENYETLITKCVVHCSRLLKRADQCRGILIASHLFWVDDKVPRPQDKPAYRNSKRVLECLQKASKIADSVMDHAISVSLFVEILEKYLWYYDKQNELVILCN
jgi:vacuolar protein sorting-associated protein 35